MTDTGLSQPNVSNHLARLRELGLVVAQRDGRKVYYRIVSPDLVRALLSSPPGKPLSDAERDDLVQENYATFQSAILAGDHESARNLVDRALTSGLSWKDAYIRFFTPVLRKVGDLWASGQLTVAQEHSASSLIDRLMSHVASLRVPSRTSRPCDAVVACVEGELHELGAHMAADFLAADGVNVAYLGANLPVKELLEYICDTSPKVVCLAATTDDRESALRQIGRLLPEYCPNGTRPVLLVGGRLIHRKPAMAEEMGARIAPENLEELGRVVREILA